MLFALFGYGILLLVCLIIFNQLTHSRCYCGKCLVEKTVLITGATSGIGYEVAKRMASRGARVIITARSGLEEAKRRLVAATHNENIRAMHLDLMSYDSIRRFAAELKATEPHLHILVNNAGVSTTQVNRTEDGHSALMQTNHLGPFLLTHLLVELLKKGAATASLPPTTAAARIVFTSSLVAYFANLSKPDEMLDNRAYQCTNLASATQEYSNSKLCNVVAAKWFGAKLARFGITANAAHPGVVRTPIFRKAFTNTGYTLSGVVGTALFWLNSRAAKDGADTIMHVALCDELENSSGHFYWDCMSVYIPRPARSDSFCQQIWSKSEELVQLKDNEKL